MHNAPMFTAGYCKRYRFYKDGRFQIDFADHCDERLKVYKGTWSLKDAWGYRFFQKYEKTGNKVRKKRILEIFGKSRCL